MFLKADFIGILGSYRCQSSLFLLECSLMNTRHIQILALSSIAGCLVSVRAGSSGWEDAFIQADHVKQRGHGILTDKPHERDLRLAEKRIEGQWRHMKDQVTRDSYYAPLDQETGRGAFYGIYTVEGEKEEMALIWSPDPRRASEKHLVIRYYADRDSPNPLFTEWVDVPLSGRTMARRNLEDINKIDVYEYLSANSKPAAKIRRGFGEVKAKRKWAPGLLGDFKRSADRLTNANRDLRVINNDLLAAKYNQDLRDKHRLRLQRFTSGELKQARREFQKSLDLYSSKYGMAKAKAALLEDGNEGLLEELE